MGILDLELKLRHEEDPSVSARLERLRNNYEGIAYNPPLLPISNQYADFGMRRTVEGMGTVAMSL